MPSGEFLGYIAPAENVDFAHRGGKIYALKARFTGFDNDGGFCEYILAYAQYLLPYLQKLADEQATPLLCAGIIGYRSLLKADLHPGERIGLIGFGASAHLAIQVGRYWGCEVYAVSRS